MKYKILLSLLLILIITPVQAKTILVLGDSLSAAYGINAKDGWVNLLHTKLKENNYDYRVINLSTSGDTTSNGLAKLPKALQRYQPDIVIVQLGANDGLRGLSVTKMKENLEKIIRESQNAHARVLLVATQLPPNYGPTYLKKFATVYEELATQYQIRLIPMFLEGVAGNSQLMQQDGLHPNNKAQARILSNIWANLEPLLST
ncbi:arylesterase [Legionella jamestowniensis]|uniref:Arylesterase n=1 Tax=Legionella jamestowniensis TaxID=455 RepID=A0A0W0UTZ0_9GAMM|nr:arylesterase [Legionella jamestowniensis]KTD11344.1 Esterase TesA precursor [Legionella jamestowniensis]OCH98797.1 arylesterase [Legionella jamestowniensis]SFL68764.1 acyl-CoA thioesterase-1 [Legionella jamestowniensis DSM 19215]